MKKALIVLIAILALCSCARFAARQTHQQIVVRDGVRCERDYEVFPRGFPDELFARWCGSPYLVLAGPDLDSDGKADFTIVWIDDEATPYAPDAISLHASGGRMWAFTEWADDRWEIRWLDPQAPGTWAEWLRAEIRPRSQVNR